MPSTLLPGIRNASNARLEKNGRHGWVLDKAVWSKRRYLLPADKAVIPNRVVVFRKGVPAWTSDIAILQQDIPSTPKRKAIFTVGEAGRLTDTSVLLRAVPLYPVHEAVQRDSVPILVTYKVSLFVDGAILAADKAVFPEREVILPEYEAVL